MRRVLDATKRERIHEFTRNNPNNFVWILVRVNSCDFVDHSFSPPKNKKRENELFPTENVTHSLCVGSSEYLSVDDRRFEVKNGTRKHPINNDNYRQRT